MLARDPLSAGPGNSKDRKAWQNSSSCLAAAWLAGLRQQRGHPTCPTTTTTTTAAAASITTTATATATTATAAANYLSIHKAVWDRQPLRHHRN